METPGSALTFNYNSFVIEDWITRQRKVLTQVSILNRGQHRLVAAENGDFLFKKRDGKGLVDYQI